MNVRNVRAVRDALEEVIEVLELKDRHTDEPVRVPHDIAPEPLYKQMREAVRLVDFSIDSFTAETERMITAYLQMMKAEEFPEEPIKEISEEAEKPKPTKQRVTPKIRKIVSKESDGVDDRFKVDQTPWAVEYEEYSRFHAVIQILLTTPEIDVKNGSILADKMFAESTNSKPNIKQTMWHFRIARRIMEILTHFEKRQKI